MSIGNCTATELNNIRIELNSLISNIDKCGVKCERLNTHVGQLLTIINQESVSYETYYRLWGHISKLGLQVINASL